MPSFEQLIQIEKSEKKKVKKPKLGHDQRGCEYCPARKHWKHGFKPVMGKVRGDRPIGLIAQNPGKEENKRGKELIGPSGDFLWEAFERVGLSRKMCDIQNAVRCLTVDRDEFGYFAPRSPSKDEVHCCSVYTEQALAKMSPKIYVIVGQLAAKQVLGKDFNSKTARIFWSDKLNAKVAVLDHPAFFLRGGSKERLGMFHKTLQAVAEELKVSDKKIPKSLKKYRILAKQDYRKVQTFAQARKAERILRKYANRGIVVTADLEWDVLDENKTLILLAGFCPKKGLGFSFVLDHPENKGNPDKRKVRRIAIRLLNDKRFKKGFHHGCSDIPVSDKLLGTELKGYAFDTEYAAYLYDSSLKKYGLSGLAERWFTEFTGYKQVIQPEANEGKKGPPHLSRVPLEKLVPYNLADCDLSKRIELKTRKHIPLPLLKIYQDASFTVSDMEKRGPLLDYKHLGVMKQIFPVRWEYYKKKLQKLAGDPELNPNSPKQMLPLLYKRFKFEPPVEIKRGEEVPQYNCRGNTIQYIYDHTKHSFPEAYLKYKAAGTIKTKAIESYENSANKHEGRLTTTFWLTGAITGRLRSGGGGQGEEGSGKQRGIVNLQNVDNDPIVQNMLISDPQWYDLQDDWVENVYHPLIDKHKRKELFAWNKDEGWYTKEAQEFQKSIVSESSLDWENWRDLEVFLLADYTGIELCILAQMSGDPIMRRAFEEGLDIHAAVGAEFTNWSYKRIISDKRIRVIVKGIHFAMIYGKTDKNLWQQLVSQGVKISLEEVEDLWAKYWKRFKRNRELLESFKEEAHEKGYVTNLFGFRRPVGTEGRNTFFDNQAVNSPIQGTAGQLLVIAMALLKRKPQTYKLLRKMRMEVHDSNVWSNKVKYLPEMRALTEKLLCHDVLDTVKTDFGITWKIPMKIDCSAGFRMGTTVKLKNEVSIPAWMNQWCIVCEDRNRAVRRELRNII